MDECVGKAVAAGRVGHLAHERGGRRGIEDVEQVVFGGVGSAGEQIEVEVATDDGREREHAPGVFAETSDAGADHFADAVGQRAS